MNDKQTAIMHLAQAALYLHRAGLITTVKSVKAIMRQLESKATPEQVSA